MTSILRKKMLLYATNTLSNYFNSIRIDPSSPYKITHETLAWCFIQSYHRSQIKLISATSSKIQPSINYKKSLSMVNVFLSFRHRLQRFCSTSGCNHKTWTQCSVTVPMKLGGVGDVTTHSSHGIYSVKPLTYDGRETILTGVALDKITLTFPTYPLSGQVQYDIHHSHLEEKLPIFENYLSA